MKNEASICAKIKEGFSKLLPGAVVYKHHDVSTIGMPDHSINWRQRSLWLEVKYLKRNETWKDFLKHFDKLQLAQAIILSRQQRTYYLVAYPSKEADLAVLWDPMMLKNFLDDSRSEVYNWRFAANNGSLAEVLTYLANRMKE